MTIEVEIRSFLTPERYQDLLAFFSKEGISMGTEEQETHYLDLDNDLRIQQNPSYSKIWMKKGKIHDESREETEVRLPAEGFGPISRIFEKIGLSPKVKWFRTRNTFSWNGVSVMLDHTKGYGHIIELEILTDEKGKEAALESLKQRLAEIGVPLTPREEFQKRYESYVQNWKEHTGSTDNP